MNRADVLRMAREAGIPDDNIPLLCHGRLETGVELLERFAQLVRNAALEEAAQLCDAECDNWDNERPIRLCANMIRIRKS